MKRLNTLLLVFTLLSGCATHEKVERGPGGTIAYQVEVDASEPGVKIEADGDYIGTTPTTLKIFGDRDGTFHHFGRYSYTIRALPKNPGQLEQVKTYRTGGWFTPEDRIPKRIYFEMRMVPADQVKNSESPMPSSSSRSTAFGTGFFITSDGYLISNYHVVADADSIVLKIKGQDISARVVEKDIQNDLVLLKADYAAKALAIGDSIRTRVGEDVFTLGFPNPLVQGTELKFSKGAVSSLTGVQDDVSHFQISVPIQGGNSGGPLIDGFGNVVGVVDSRLNDKYMIARYGSVPQNVCYAIKGTRIKNLLERFPEVTENLPTAQFEAGKSVSDLYDVAAESVVRIEASRP